MIKKNRFLLIFLTFFNCVLFSQKKDSIDLKIIDSEIKNLEKVNIETDSLSYSLRERYLNLKKKRETDLLDDLEIEVDNNIKKPITSINSNSFKFNSSNISYNKKNNPLMKPEFATFERDGYAKFNDPDFLNKKRNYILGGTFEFIVKGGNTRTSLIKYVGSNYNKQDIYQILSSSLSNYDFLSFEKNTHTFKGKKYNYIVNFIMLDKNDFDNDNNLNEIYEIMKLHLN